MGHAETTRPPWDRENFDRVEPTEQETIDRARWKLDQIRDGMVRLRPAGVFWIPVVGAAIWGGLAAVLLFFAYRFANDYDMDNDPLVWFLGIPGALLLIPTVLIYIGSRATTPKRALNLFYRSIGRGRYDAARSLVVANDFDHFPRAFPDVAKVPGFPTADPAFFENRDDFREYWATLTRWPTAPYCIARVRGVRITEIAPDVVHCEYTLKLGINTSLWILIIFLPFAGLLIALIVDAATRTNITEHMSKLLVRVDDEWKLMNGAWHETDDLRAAWE